MSTIVPDLVASGAHLVGSVPLASSEAVFRAVADEIGGSPPAHPRRRDRPAVRLDRVAAARLHHSAPARGGAARRRQLAAAAPRPPRRRSARRERDLRGARVRGRGAVLVSSLRAPQARRRGAGGLSLPGLPTHPASPPSAPSWCPSTRSSSSPSTRSKCSASCASSSRNCPTISSPSSGIPISSSGCWRACSRSGSDDVKGGILERLLRISRHVPADVQLGYHLCYGDVQHRHFKEPADAGRLVEVANALAASLGRPLNWIHLPVPRERLDEAYYAPLRIFASRRVRALPGPAAPHGRRRGNAAAHRGGPALRVRVRGRHRVRLGPAAGAPPFPISCASTPPSAPRPAGARTAETRFSGPPASRAFPSRTGSSSPWTPSVSGTTPSRTTAGTVTSIRPSRTWRATSKMASSSSTTPAGQASSSTGSI